MWVGGCLGDSGFEFGLRAVGFRVEGVSQSFAGFWGTLMAGKEVLHYFHCRTIIEILRRVLILYVSVYGSSPIS